MSYHRRRLAKPLVMSGVVSFITDVFTGGGVKGVVEHAAASGSFSLEKCDRARESATTELDAQTVDLAKNWKPTGFYKTSDMQQMRDRVFDLLLKASAAIEQVIAEPLMYKPTLRMAQGKVQQQLADALVYTTAISTAIKNGVRIIDSPGFKRWVIESMNAASVAYGHVAYMSCIKPAVATLIEWAVRAWQVIVTIGKAMVKATIAAGEQVLRIPDAFDAVWTYTKWGGLALGALWLASKVKKDRSLAP